MNPSYKYRASLVRVIDGDTIDVIIDLGFGVMFGNPRDPRRLRLAGIDTPELRSKDETERMAAKAAKKFVIDALRDSAWTGDKTAVECWRPLMVQTLKTRSGKERQTFGRYVAEVWYQRSGVWVHLNAELVDEGHAAESKG